MVVQLGYWIEVKDGDPRAKGIQSRHYSAHHYKDGRRPLKIVGPGEYMLLLTSDCSALFGWQYSTRPRKDGQQGVNCFIFRNEGPILSSELIKEAVELAWKRWPDERLYTYVNGSAIHSSNPGYCFQMAGWSKCGTSPGGLTILELTK